MAPTGCLLFSSDKGWGFIEAITHRKVTQEQTCFTSQWIISHPSHSHVLFLFISWVGLLSLTRCLLTRWITVLITGVNVKLLKRLLSQKEGVWLHANAISQGLWSTFPCDVKTQSPCGLLCRKQTGSDIINTDILKLKDDRYHEYIHNTYIILLLTAPGTWLEWMFYQIGSFKTKHYLVFHSSLLFFLNHIHGKNVFNHRDMIFLCGILCLGKTWPILYDYSCLVFLEQSSCQRGQFNKCGGKNSPSAQRCLKPC